MIVMFLTSWAVGCCSGAFILWQRAKRHDSVHVGESQCVQPDKPIQPHLITRAATEQGERISKRHVLVQSMTTYTSLRGVSHPRFLPLRNSLEGAWVDTHHQRA